MFFFSLKIIAKYFIACLSGHMTDWVFVEYIEFLTFIEKCLFLIEDIHISQGKLLWGIYQGISFVNNQEILKNWRILQSGLASVWTCVKSSLFHIRISGPELK